MPVTASRLFDFFAERPECSIERHEIASATFGDLRRSLRLMIVALAEGGDWEAKEVADRLRSVISEWLTVPVRFDDAVLRVLREMGEPPAIETRWGRDIRSHFEDACRAAEDLMARKNPIREALSRRIQILREEGRSFRIFCHRRSREHFDSLPAEFGTAALPENTFIHSVAEYRETEPFHSLVKVGPLRSRGWGSAPDALLTAPRFDTLIQVVWSGCSDEPGFGYDPVAPPSQDAGSQSESSVADRYHQSLHLKWAVRETRSRDGSISTQGNIPDMNDLDVFTRLAQPVDVQRATLVQVDDAHGILYPPHSRVLSFDIGPDSIGYRLPGETLQEGMYLILPVVDDVRLAGLQAEEGRFSRLWKERLNAEFRHDPAALVKRLQDAGLRLLQLRSRIEHWCRAPSTVIHAPQQMRHFEILIKVLGLDFDANQNAHRPRAAWWQFAWDEIRRARGEAIQTGFQEQQIIDEQLLVAVRTLDADIQAHLGREAFQISIPPSQPLRGLFRFYRVRAIEEGFQAPPGELKMLCELSRIDQWRA
jgi:hypothetical protein